MQRPPGQVLVVTKSMGPELLARTQELMRRDHPHVQHHFGHGSDRLRTLSSCSGWLSTATSSPFRRAKDSELMPVEAMAAGCAVVGFHGGGGGQFMRPGENCEAVAYPALEELCERLARVLTDDEHAGRIARGAGRTAGEFGLAAFEERWTGFLEAFSLVPSPPRGDEPQRRPRPSSSG